MVEREAILYNRNLKQILKGTPFQYSAMERFVKHGKYREKMYLDQYLEGYRYMPGIEQLVKCGFYRIVKEKMQGYNTGNLKKKERSCKKDTGAKRGILPAVGWKESKHKGIQHHL